MARLNFFLDVGNDELDEVRDVTEDVVARTVSEEGCGLNSNFMLPKALPDGDLCREGDAASETFRDDVPRVGWEAPPREIVRAEDGGVTLLDLALPPPEESSPSSSSESDSESISFLEALSGAISTKLSELVPVWPDDLVRALSLVGSELEAFEEAGATLRFFLRLRATEKVPVGFSSVVLAFLFFLRRRRGVADFSDKEEVELASSEGVEGGLVEEMLEFWSV